MDGSANDLHWNTSPRPGTMGIPQCAADLALFNRMCDVMAGATQEDVDGLIRDLRDTGVSDQTIADDYIPLIARHFGEGWVSDQYSFTQVTIAGARLQTWLRDMDSHRLQVSPFCMDAPEVLVVVPWGSQHTLGAMVLASQFRRLGAVVRLSLCQESDSVGLLVRRQAFDLVAISVACNDGLEKLHALVNKIRMGAGPAPKVLIGGNILNLDPDVGQKVGADGTTSNAREALAFCGHTPLARTPSMSSTITPQAAARRNTASLSK